MILPQWPSLTFNVVIRLGRGPRRGRLLYTAVLLLLSVIIGMSLVSELFWLGPPKLLHSKRLEFEPITSLQLPISNILLLGQFNYHTPAVHVKAWMKIWSKYFSKIAVAGPFNDKSYTRGLSCLMWPGKLSHLGTPKKPNSG